MTPMTAQRNNSLHGVVQVPPFLSSFTLRDTFCVQQTIASSPFAKGENADFVHGIGVGLAIVRHAINLHKGQVFVETNHPKGTAIRVVLPSLSNIFNLPDI